MIGFHYFPDDVHYRAKDLKVWLPELKALGASWVTLRGSLARAIPESFLRPLIESGIEPIIYLQPGAVQAVDLDALEVLYRCYASWGARYVVVYDQPNTRAAWPAEAWGHDDLVNTFLDLLLPTLQLAQANGLTPVFPPLKQVGDYWDTSFLDKALVLMKGRDHTPLLEVMTFGIYGFTNNRPVDWGAGGPTQWSAAKPYNVPPGSQDQSGFRAFEWYADVIRNRLGSERPMVMLAGGADPDDADSNECNTAIARAALAHDFPSYLLNVNFWLLAGDERAAWRRSDGTALPALEAVRQLAATARQTEAATPAQSKGIPKHLPTSLKPIYHYLLLPSAEWSNWIAALEYVRKFRPTCGFSIEEAVYAAHVTLLGDEGVINAEVEHALRAAGCEVERVCAGDAIATQDQLNARASAGTRFATL